MQVRVFADHPSLSLSLDPYEIMGEKELNFDKKDMMITLYDHSFDNKYHLDSNTIDINRELIE